MSKKIIIIFSLLIVTSTFSKAQIIGFGASGIYNIQTESVGIGLRASVFPNKRISLVPQFSYFFSFNKINEYTLGLGIEGKVVKYRNINLYALVHGGYNNWLNYKSSPMKDTKPTNWNFEGGIGITTNHCLRPFLEYRYNTKFKETHLNFGILYIFGCKNNSATTGVDCPTF